MPWPGPSQPSGPGGQPPGPPATSRKTLWIAFAAGLAAVAVAAGVAVAVASGGTRHPSAASSSRSGGPAAGGGTALPTLSQPASPSASSSGTAPPAPPACPASPRTGPRHTLSFPSQIGSYQQALKPVTTSSTPMNGTSLCALPVRRASYSNSANDFFDVYAGYHGDLWTSYTAFWQSFNGGTKVTMFPAGSLGGQVGCIKLPSAGSICTWFDSDTFGEVVGSDPEPHTATELNAFRAAIEHAG